MKIAIVAEPYLPVPPKAYGGVEMVIFYLIKGLQELGHEPILIGTADSTVDCEIVPIADKAVFFPNNSSKIPEFKKQIHEIWLNTNAAIKKTLPRVDVLHSHGFDIKEFGTFPNVYTLHGKFVLDSKLATVREKIAYYLERENLNYVSISNNQREALPQLNYLGTVYNGEDPSLFPFVEKPEDYLCFLGRFDEEKNPHMAIQLAIEKDMKIKLAGKIDYQGNEYFKKEVKPLLKHPLVEYLGELGFKDKVELISKARVNLHPTGFREPFGLTILEAAYCGTPTMAIARGSMPELIKEEVTGMLVEDFAEGLWALDKCFKMDRRLIADRSRRKFNYIRMTRGYIKAYKKAIKQSKKEQNHYASLAANPIRV